jgi:endonuclease-3
MHCAPPPLPFSTLFEAIIWECCAYLVDDDRRAAVFDRLRKTIGVDPARILAAPSSKLQAALEEGGMNLAGRAEKLRDASTIMLEVGEKALSQLVREDPKKARKVLKRFPQVGDPGADWLLLFGGGPRAIAPESNALRVLLRLGYGEESGNYSKEYRSAEEAVGQEMPPDSTKLVQLRQLLRTHGQEICTRTKPRCEVCGLSRNCAFFARG